MRAPLRVDGIIHSSAQAAAAFARSAPGKAFPELWFELPLAGPPWFDLHVLTAAGDLDGPPEPDQCGGYPQAFDWFRKQPYVRQLALSWDLTFRADGAAGLLMAEVEKWGLADSRWHQMEDTSFARRVTLGPESCLLYCAPVFVKLRWKNGEPLDANAYLMAGVR